MIVKFVDRLLPIEATNRPCRKMIPQSITIHECNIGTKPDPKYKDEEYYTNLVYYPKVRCVGYHYLVASDKIIRFIPDNEIAIHTGSISGNLQSIGIERVVNVTTDFEAAISIQAKLSATLMYKYKISIHSVVTHNLWRGKKCPARLLAGLNGGWENFIKLVNNFYQKEDYFEQILIT